MCKYCNLKEGESKILDEEKYIKLIIQKNRNSYYLVGIGEGLESEFKLKYCPECGRNLQKKEPLDKRFKQIFISKNISVTLLYENGKIFVQDNYYHDDEVIHNEIYRMDNINFDEPDIEYIKRIIFKEDQYVSG